MMEEINVHCEESPHHSSIEAFRLPPLDSGIFSGDLSLPEFFFDNELFDFDFSFDDLDLPDDGRILALDPEPDTASPLDPCSDDCRSRNPYDESASGNLGLDVGTAPISDLCSEDRSFVDAVLNSRSPDSVSSVRDLSGPSSSQGSGNCSSSVSRTNHDHPPAPDSRSFNRDDCSSPSPQARQNSINPNGSEPEKKNIPKRKRQQHEDEESRGSKHRRETGIANAAAEASEEEEEEEDEKKRARLMRNRESAQLSRQRKKHYVEELEEKVRSMHSTIQDLNGRISYFMAENAQLRNQLSGGNLCVPPPAIYPHHPVAYPWMPCTPYIVKSTGSNVPLVPIPRLKRKTTPTAQTQHTTTKGKSKTENNRTKKVASISFLGLLFFIFLLGGLIPMMNLKYRNRSEPDREESTGPIQKSINGRSRVIPLTSEHGTESTVAKPLLASLYVPRNDNLVKIDGNLIIHSVLASEKAMTSSSTGLAVPARSFRQGSSSPSSIDVNLQQWFREGLSGPMLSSGVCTEVFKFNVSPRAVISSSSSSMGNNVSVNCDHEHDGRSNRTEARIKIGRNRRFLHDLRMNGTESKNEASDVAALSSMVVSVLVDPRDDADLNKVSRFFVVILIDSVRYVTYSCGLPYVGSGPHLVAK